MRMFQRKHVILLLLIFVTAGLSAVELDYHVGAGVSVPFIKSTATFAFPSVYGGIGANIIPELAVGAEYEGFGIYLLGYGFVIHMPRVYVKYDMSDMFTLSGLGGVAFPSGFTPDGAQTLTEYNVGFVGLRATLFFMYGEFLIPVTRDLNGVSLISLGVAIKK